MKLMGDLMDKILNQPVAQVGEDAVEAKPTTDRRSFSFTITPSLKSVEIDSKHPLSVRINDLSGTAKVTIHW